jgi:hypothetical protein
MWAKNLHIERYKYRFMIPAWYEPANSAHAKASKRLCKAYVL